jgi:hypothetical protein
MTKRNQTKEIYTFTRLLELTEQLKASNPREYRELMGWRGTHKLVDGLGIQAERNESNCLVRFNFMHPGQHDHYCTLSGSVVEGKCYTRWVSKFSTSYFSKKLHRFLPWDLPEGVKMRENTPVMFFNANGTLALHRNAGWYGASRGSWGYACDTIAIRDFDGKFMLRSDAEGLPLGRPDPVQECLGIAPDSVGPREWFDSMVGPHWNSNKVRLLAIKAYKEALRIVEAHGEMRIALYPMQEKKVGDEYEPSRVGKFKATTHVIERDSDMEPIMYRMPELCLYWVSEAEKHPTISPQKMQSIYVTIPPHGCRLLEMDCEKIPESNKTFRHGRRTAPDAYNHAISRGAPLERVAYTFGPKTKGPEGSVNWGNNPELVKVKVMGEGSKALKPEDAFNSLEEAALMGSLPLC